MAIDFKKLREMAEVAHSAAVQRQREEAERAKQEQKALHQRRQADADRAIELIPAELEEWAKRGCSEATVYFIEGRELVSKPARGFFTTAYSPGCLPDYARKVWDHCKKMGSNHGCVNPT